jgi:DUF4097 and DUF4098 domain-containing protein YvlB
MTRTMMMLLISVALTVSLLAAPVEKELPFSPGEKLEIQLKSGGSINLSGWDRDRIHVVATPSRSYAGAVSIDRAGAGVKIETDHGGRRSSGNVDLVIRVPRRLDVSLNTMGGRVRITGVEGRLSGTTMGGAVDLSRIAGNVQVTTMGGPITLRDSDVDGSLKTMGGNVLFENVIGNVTGSSMGGNVTQKNVRARDGGSDAKPMVVSTMGGNVVIDEAPAGAEASTMGGNIRIRSAREFAKAKTMGGNITIEAVEGWVDASTMGGDVEVTMTGSGRRGKRDITISSKSGNIVLTVPRDLEFVADVEIAYTANSRRSYRLTSDFPLAVTETDQWTRVSGTPTRYIRGAGRIGAGTNKLTIRTINGDVTIRRGR